MIRLLFIRYPCALFLLLIVQAGYSQLSFHAGNYEAGISVSPSNFLGDLGGTSGKGGAFLKDNNLSNTKILVGAHLTLYPTSWSGIRLAVTYGSIAGDDALIKGSGGEEESRKARNLDFKSKISEAYIAVEFFPTVFLENDASDVFHKIRPYMLIGAGVFHFDPQGKDPATGKWVSLKELHTEGEGFAEYPYRKNYKLTQVNIPMGVGLKYFLNSEVSLSVEFLTRKTFTDYIDDVSGIYIDKDLFYKYLPLDKAILANRMYDKSVSPANRNAGEVRGNNKNMDAYYSTGLKLSFMLGNDRFNTRYTRCPVRI